MATITIDRTAKQLVLTVQEYSLFAHRAVMNLFSAPRYWPEFLVQSDIIGFGSATIVLMAGFFTGGVLALQSDSGVGPGAYRHHGLRPQRILDGQRTRLHGRDRAD